MKAILISILCSAAFAIAGCASKPNPYLIAQQIENAPPPPPEFKYLVGQGYFSEFNTEIRSCSAVSLGGGKFLTASACLEAHKRNYVRSISGKNYNIDIIKQGQKYLSIRTINNNHKNYVVVYTSDLVMPAVKIARGGMKQGAKVCVVYWQSVKDDSSFAADFNPVKKCGKVTGEDSLHSIVRWDDVGNIAGFWGGGVFNSSNELVGIVSYRTDDTSQSGILRIDSFRDEIQEL